MEIQRQSGSRRAGEKLYTGPVLVRHNPKRPDQEKGGDWSKCDCRKSILVYNGATRKQDRISAHTRSWAQASIQVEQWLDQFDPFKIERKKEEAQAVTIETAVFSYLQDMITRLGDNGTVWRARTLFGDVNAQGNAKRDGKLFACLKKQVPRPTFISYTTLPPLSPS